MLLVESRSLDNVVGRVVQEVKEEIQLILESGLKEANDVLKEAEREAESESSRIAEMTNRLGESRLKQIIGSAELEARNKTLRLVEERINDVMLAALKELREKKSKNYNSSLKKMVIEGMNSIPDGDMTVASNKEDRKSVEQIVNEINKKSSVKITLSEESLDSVGGVEIRSSDGDIIVGNTIEQRLERMKPELKMRVAETFLK